MFWNPQKNMHKGAIHPTISFHASGSPIYIVDLIIKINEMSKQNLNWSFQPCILQVAQFMSSDHTPLFKSRDIFPPLRHLRPSNPWPLEKWIAPPPAGCFKCRFFSTRASVIVSWICFVRILEDQNTVKQMCQVLLQEMCLAHFMSAHFLLLLRQWKNLL